MLNGLWIDADDCCCSPHDSSCDVPLVCCVVLSLEPIAKNGTLVTILDGHPATLSWLGGVRGHYVESLGVEHFGQSGSIDDLYQHYGLDTKTIIERLRQSDTLLRKKIDQDRDRWEKKVFKLVTGEEREARLRNTLHL